MAVEIAVGGPIDRLCARLAPVLTEALMDGGIDAVFAGASKSFVAHREHGFLLHASVHAPEHHTRAHDHAEAWAVYGIAGGQTAYRLYVRGIDRAPGVATLALVREHVATRGETAIVLPGQVHENWNPGETLAWNLVIRPRPLGDLARRRYIPESGVYVPL